MRVSAWRSSLLPRLCCLTAVWVGTGALRAQQPAETTAPTIRAGYASVPLRRLPPGVVAVDVLIDGQRARLIVDTGDGVPGLGLTTSTVRRLKMKTEPSARQVRGVSGAEVVSGEVGRASVVRFGDSTVELRDVAVQVANFPVLEAQPLSAAGRLPVDGFLGADVLRTCGATIDLPAMRLHLLRSPGSSDSGDAAPSSPDGATTEVAMRTDPSLGEPLWVVPVEINGTAATMLVDTGNWATRVATSQASRFGLRRIGAGRSATDAAGTVVKTERARARTFTIDGAVVPAAAMPPLLLGPMGPWVRGDLVGALGIDTLRACGAVIDCRRSRLYLRRPL